MENGDFERARTVAPWASWLAGIFLTSVCFTGRAAADPMPEDPAGDTPRRVAIAPFKGPRSAPVRKRMLAGLKDEPTIDIVDWKLVRATSREFEADLRTTEGRTAVAQELSVSAYIDCRVRKKRKRWSIACPVTNAATGETVGEWSTDFDNRAALLSAARNDAWTQLADSIGATTVPSNGTPPPAEAVPEEPAPVTQGEPETAVDTNDDSERPPSRTSETAHAAEEDAETQHDALELAIYGGVFNRKLEYNRALYPDFARYRLAAAPRLFGELRWFPFAHVGTGVLAHFGLDLRGEYALAVSSRDDANTTYPTKSWGVFAGGRARLPIGRQELFAVAGYGIQRFEADRAQGKEPPYPDLDYRYVQLEVGGRLRIARFFFEARGAWLYVFRAGEIATSEWLKNANAGGIEANATLGYDVFEGLEVRLGGGVRHFAFDFNKTFVNPLKSDVAADRYLWGFAGLAYTIRGP